MVFIFVQNTTSIFLLRIQSSLSDTPGSQTEPFHTALTPLSPFHYSSPTGQAPHSDVPPSLPLAAAKLRTFLLPAHSIAIFSFSSAHNSLILHISESESPLPGNAFSLEEHMQQTPEKQTHEHQAKHFITPQKQKMLQKCLISQKDSLSLRVCRVHIPLT